MKLQRGRQINHSDKVDFDTLDSIEPHKDHRQMLSYCYKGRRSKKRATVVLMNPSGADKSMADNTIRRVEDIVHHIFPKIKEVHIYNLFSVRGKSPRDVNELYQKKGLEALLYKGTDDLLAKSAQGSELSIAAWGGPCGIERKLHQMRVDAILEILRESKKIYRIAGGHYSPDAAYPLHGRLWSYSMRPFIYK